ncbi:MAG: hypothetical protein IRZ26_08565, partial [Clostridia bacterium]|nr:hypothetical protein [Clostridia bacterium]
MSAGGAAVRLDPLERALALAGEALAALLGAEMALRWLPWLAARLPALLLLLLWSGLRARRLPRAARGDAAPWLREGQVRDALLLLAAALAGLAGRPDGAALAGFALLLLGHLAALPSGRRLALLAAAGAAAAALAVAALLAVAPLRRGLERLLLDLILGAGWLLGEGVALLVGLLRRLAGGGPGAAPAPPPAPPAAGRAQPAWAGSLAGGLAILLLGAAGLLLAALGARLLLGRLRAPESPEEREARDGIRILRSPLEEPPGRRPPRPA